MDSSKRRFDESNTGAHEEPDKKKLAMSALERAKMIAAKISGAATGSSSNPLSASTSNSSASYGAGSGSFYPAGGSFSRKVWIPQTPGINYVGLIIGPKAKTLRDLQARTNCLLQVRGRGLAKVSYDENGQVEEPHVFISGQTDESVELARKIIQEIMDNPDKAEEIKRSQNLGGDLSGSAQTGSLGSIYGMSTDTYGSITKIVHVPNELAGAVIGRGGDQIRQFQMQSQANIQIDNSPEAMTKSQRNITVQGTKEQVEAAERIITEFVRRKQGGDSGATALDFPVQIKLEVPDNKVGLIIGKQGKTVGRIQQQFRCKVDIPVQHDDGNPLVRTLTVGAHTSEELESAKNDIVSVVTYGMPTQQPVYAAVPTSYPAAYPTMMSETKSLMIPDDLATAVTGHDGSIIQDIQLRTNCRVQIPQAADVGSNPATRTLSITGRSDQIVLAISEIKSIVERHGGQAYELSAASSGMAAYGGYGSQYPQCPGYGAQYAQGYGQGFAQYGAAYPQGNSYGQYVDTTNQGYSAPLPPSTEQSALSRVSTNTSGTEQNGNSSNNTEQLVQKYTKAQWLQWKEYYKSQGIEIADDAPEELRAEPYE